MRRFLILGLLVLVVSVGFAEEGVLVPKGDVIEDFESGQLENWSIVSGDLKKQPSGAVRGNIAFGQQNLPRR